LYGEDLNLFEVMVIVSKAFKDEPKVFYDFQEEFSIWKDVVLCVWSFSTLCCFLSTLCCKFSKSIQTLIANQLVEFFNKIPSHQPLQIESKFDAYGPTSCPNQSECKLLPPLMDSLVISHIFPHLPMTFHVLVHVTRQQGMVYDCCKKHLLECNGDGGSKP
jgi:hypothetical protein